MPKARRPVNYPPPADDVTQRAVLSLITRLVGQANVLTIPRIFIDLTGSHEAALLLSQILYWSERTRDPDGWFYKTAADWEAELALSEYQVRKARKVLEPLGLETKLRAVNNVPVQHYRLDGPQFYKSILHFLQNAPATESQKHPGETAVSSYTEITDRDHGQNGGSSPDANLLIAIRHFAGQHHQSVTPERVGRLAAQAGTLARWQAASAGARSLAEVEAALGA